MGCKESNQTKIKQSPSSSMFVVLHTHIPADQKQYAHGLRYQGYNRSQYLSLLKVNRFLIVCTISILIITLCNDIDFHKIKK